MADQRFLSMDKKWSNVGTNSATYSDNGTQQWRFDSLRDDKQCKLVFREARLSSASITMT